MGQDVFHWLALSLTPGVGSILLARLVARFGSPEAVFRASVTELGEIDGLTGKVAEEIRKGPQERAVDRELERVRAAGARILTLSDEAYPSRLKEIYDPPAVLYVNGELKKEDDLAVSIVGSRKTSVYGRMMTERMSQGLARHGVTIVSGMARGIDSVAHGGAVSVGGRTIAVLGCGVDVIYPRENRGLFAKIVEHGAVVSEFPMGSPPEGAHFPKRNRIISGLSLGVIVVEAAAESGALITANYALEQGRDVFAVPGSIGAAGSQGTHRLIKQGAKLVEASEDILEEILPQWHRRGQEHEKAKQGPSLPEEEGRLYDLLGETPLHIDRIILETGMDPGKVSGLLLSLELKGLIAQWPGKNFTKK